MSSFEVEDPEFQIWEMGWLSVKKTIRFPSHFPPQVRQAARIANNYLKSIEWWWRWGGHSACTHAVPSMAPNPMFDASVYNFKSSELIVKSSGIMEFRLRFERFWIHHWMSAWASLFSEMWWWICITVVDNVMRRRSNILPGRMTLQMNDRTNKWKKFAFCAFFAMGSGDLRFLCVCHVVLWWWGQLNR